MNNSISCSIKIKLLLIITVFCNNKIVFAGPCYSLMKCNSELKQLEIEHYWLDVAGEVFANDTTENISTKCKKFDGLFRENKTLLIFILTPSPNSLAQAKAEMRRIINLDNIQSVREKMALTDARIDAAKLSKTINKFLSGAIKWKMYSSSSCMWHEDRFCIRDGETQISNVKKYLLNLANNRQDIIDSSDATQQLYEFFNDRMWDRISSRPCVVCERWEIPSLNLGIPNLLRKAIKDIKRINQLLLEAQVQQPVQIAVAQEPVIQGQQIVQQPVRLIAGVAGGVDV